MGEQYTKFIYTSPISKIPQDVEEYIKRLNGAIIYARQHPKTNQKGLNPEFWQRLKAENIQTIPVDGKSASHKLAWGTANVDGKPGDEAIIYPQIYSENGKLIYESDMQKAFKKALETNNYIIADNEQLADDFTKYYKQADAFKGFAQFNPIQNKKYWNTVQDNFPKLSVAYNKLMQSGLTKEQTAAVLGNIVVESWLNEYQKEGNGGNGEGLGQWTDAGRKQRMHEFKGFPGQTEFERQLDFLITELDDKSVWAGKMKDMKTFFTDFKIPYKYNLNSYTDAFMNGWERPNKKWNHQADRRQVAQYLLSPDFQTKLSFNLIDFTTPATSPSANMPILPFMSSHKSGGTIKIKKKNIGSFTRYCNGKVTEECIRKGKNSSNPTTRKRANFAANARKWKHEDGGKINYLNCFN